MSGSSISQQSCIAYTVEILQLNTMSISTGHVRYHCLVINLLITIRDIAVLFALYVTDNSNQGAIPN